MAKTSRAQAKTPEPTEPDLGVFEGKRVKGIAISLNVGSGLTQAMEINPVVLKHRDEGYALIKFSTRDITHGEAVAEYGEDGELIGWTVPRIQTLRPLGATILSPEAAELVGSVVDEMIQKVADLADIKRAAKEGRVRLPLGETGPSEPPPASKVTEIRPGVLDDEGASDPSTD
jgi:hypothetical protein